MDKRTYQLLGILALSIGAKLLILRYVAHMLKDVKIQHEVSVKSELFK